jgi:hypothetical protein
MTMMNLLAMAKTLNSACKSVLVLILSKNIPISSTISGSCNLSRFFDKVIAPYVGNTRRKKKETRAQIEQ